MTSEEFSPVIRLGKNLLVSLRGNLDDETVLELESRVTSEIGRMTPQGVLLDVSGLLIVDSFIGRVLGRLVAMIRLLGAEAVVVGMQPAVAITLVELGIRMDHIATALDAERGMTILERLGDRRGRETPRS